MNNLKYLPNEIQSILKDRNYDELSSDLKSRFSVYAQKLFKNNPINTEHFKDYLIKSKDWNFSFEDVISSVLNVDQFLTERNLQLNFQNKKEYIVCCVETRTMFGGISKLQDIVEVMLDNYGIEKAIPTSS